jgi:molecular chaperone HscB
MLDLKQDFFALFGLPTGFPIDMDRLEQAYLDIQGRVHPDRFAHLPDLDKRLSMQWATHANEAFRTLKSPLARGQYLLELRASIRPSTPIPPCPPSS